MPGRLHLGSLSRRFGRSSSPVRKLAKAGLAALLAATGILSAAPTATAAPILGGQLFATGKAVTVEVLPASAGLTSTLWLLEPREASIATNREVGKVVSIGEYASGVELIFGIRVNNQEFRMGPASRNPDGQMHATVDFSDDGCAVVGFEDLFGGGDRDYNDNMFRFCGGIAEQPPEPPEPPAPSPFVGPQADAGDDQSVPEGSVVTLDATRSKASNLVTHTYTTTADFGQGTSISLSDVPPDQLQLDETTRAFGFIWIAASARGTVIKIDTATGKILGEYWSAPQNRAKDPSRTTVDNNGNVWVGNRAEASSIGGVAKGSVTQIGLAENGQCIDRNGNGVIDTSTGLGDIEAWPNSSGVDNDGGVDTAADECIVNYVRTDGVAIRQVAVDADNHIWVGGAAQGGSPSYFDRISPDGAIVRKINMRLAADTGRGGAVACCYGGLVDPSGILWSSSGVNTLVRIDPSKPNGDPDLMKVIDLGRTSYGLGIDPDGYIWDANWTSNTVTKVSPAGAIVARYSTGGASDDRGVAVTADGNVWIANSGGSNVSRLRPDGTVAAVINVGSTPTGIAVDAAGKVWATNLSSSTASRIDPATNAVDLTVNLGSGAGPYNYSDMTGSTLTGAPDDGTWSVVYDSGAADTAWAHVDWTAKLAGNATLQVLVASSADGTTFGQDVVVADGTTIEGLADGRYLRVTVRFTRASTGESPILYDLTVAHEGDRANTLAYLWRLVGVDGPPVFLSSATSPTPSFVAPDDATYRFELTVTDSAGQSDSDEVKVTVTNVAPAVKADVSSPVARGVTLVSGSFTDAGWLDTHKASFDWGDGSAVDSAPVNAQGSGWGTFFGSHVYPSAGTYHMVVTLADDDGGKATVDLGRVAVLEPVAIWANSKTQSAAFSWTGSGGAIAGRVHSNNDVKITAADTKMIGGPVEYVSTASIPGGTSLVPARSTVQPFPLTYNLADYAPGGPVATQVGAAYYDHSSDCVAGTYDVGSTLLPAGVHYAPCAVKLNGSSIRGRITLVATGAITLSGSRPAFEPYYDGLLLLSGASGRKAIDVAASSSKFLGIIYAASGEVSLSGSSGRYFCGIYGDTVTSSGADLTVRGANCGRPDSTISGPLLVPDLKLSIAADPVTTLPGGRIAYDLKITNSGALLAVPGIIGLENVDTTSATVTGVSYDLEYFSIAKNVWVSIASLADGTIALVPRANAAPGVTYPAPNKIVGTQIAGGGFATWGYQALVNLTPEQVTLLLDPARVGGFRNRVEFTVDPASVQMRRLFTYGTDFVAALRALSGDVKAPSITFLPPVGDLVTIDSSSRAELAALGPGQSVNLPQAFVVPVPAGRQATETDAGYLSRLLNLNGSSLVGSSFALAQGGVGLLVAPLVTASTAETLPVVSISTVGPGGIPAGTSAEYSLRLANLGGADASALTLAAAAGSSVLALTGVPGSLKAGELASASATYTAPGENPPADVTVTGTTGWSDAAGNTYGPLASSMQTAILTPALMSATLVDTLLTDVNHDGQVSPGDTIRYTLTVTDHGDIPLANVVASAAPDTNSRLVVGSVAVPGGTVESGNSVADSDVRVTLASIAGKSSATVTFDVVVNDPFPAGLTGIETQGHVAAAGLTPILSDDPSTPASTDATRSAVLVPAPNLAGYLTGRLYLDGDGNGYPSAGDTLRYELTVSSMGSLPVSGVAVAVPVPAAATLVPGSVTTTAGTVGAGGISVAVGPLGPLTIATIGFDLKLVDPLPAGTGTISVQGTVTSVEIASVTTDDPNTPAIDDPTAIVVGPGGGINPSIPGPTIGGVLPLEGAPITAPTTISTTLTPPVGETIAAWTVSYHLQGDSTSTQIASGSGTRVEATFDPTVVTNGSYVIEISATGSAGGISTATVGLIVEGNLKLGRFQVTYQDANVAVGGIPIQVRRTYDSFDKSKGDFGIGWRVDVANFRVATNGPLGRGGWQMQQCGVGLIFVPLCFSTIRPHFVTVTWPDGHVETFDLTPAQGSTFLAGLTSAKFTPRPGSTSTLEALDSGIYWSNGDLLGGFLGSGPVYDPTQFRLTDKSGLQYVLDTTKGLLSSTDRSGNTITVGPSGVKSSLGPSVIFKRDAQNRIAELDKPDGAKVLYGYDPAGDLVSVTDELGNVVRLEYDSAHNLTGTIDPLGRVFSKVEYDEFGRMKSVTDATGNTTAVTSDPSTRQETVVDPTGRQRTVSSFNLEGDLVRVDVTADGRTATTTFEYDANHNVTKRTDPAGYTVESTYDSKGNLLTYKDANGSKITLTYDAIGFPSTWSDSTGLSVTYRWNSNGTLASFGDALGNGETYAYDGAGNMTARVDREGNRFTYTFDSLGRIKTATDARAKTTSYEYFPDGSMRSITDPLGHVSSYEYDAAGNLTKQTDPTRTSSYAYDTLGFLKSTTIAGRATSIVRDGNGRQTELHDPLGAVSYTTYDDAGRVRTSKDALGRVTTYEYDGFGNLAKETDPLGRVTSYEHDLRGLLVATTNPAGGVSRYEYDGDGNCTKEIDPHGDVTTKTYWPHGELKSVTDPLGNTTAYDHDAMGQLRKVTDPTGATTLTNYDRAGRLVETISPTGAVTKAGYDATGNLVTMTDPLGKVTKFAYDDGGRQVSVTDALDHTSFSEYDAAGRITKQTSASGVAVVYQYDERGLVTSITDSLGHVVKRTYDDAARLKTETDARGYTTTYDYDAAGNLKKVTDALGHFVGFDYDAAGQRISLADANGNAWRSAYDALGNVKSTTDPLGRTATWTYDAGARLTSSIDARGIETTYGYDDDDRLVSRSAAGGTISTAYDAAGRRTSMVSPGATVGFGYDRAGRLTSVTQPGSPVTYTYDAAGRRLTMTVGARTTTYGYDDAGRLTSVSRPDLGSFGFTYENDGRLKSLTRPNNVTTARGYDLAGRLTSLTHTAGASTLASYTYTLDASGNRTAVDGTDGHEGYTLDAAGRLTDVSYADGSAMHFAYDAAGNRTRLTAGGSTTSYTYDAAGQLTSAGPVTFTYDKAGNRTSAGASTFTYDAFGNLASATVAGATTTYGYTGDGLRVSSTSGGATATSTYDLNLALPALLSDGIAGYVTTDLGLLAEITPSGASMPLTDALGSVRAQTNASGGIVASASYDAFGATRSSSGSVGSLGFTGAQTDPTGLVYLQARYLDPATGTFLARDPVTPGAPGITGYNPYAYAGQNPTTLVDPSGREAVAEWTIIDWTILAAMVALTAVWVISIEMQYCQTHPGVCTLPRPPLPWDNNPPYNPPLNPPMPPIPPLPWNTDWDKVTRALQKLTEALAKTAVATCLASMAKDYAVRLLGRSPDAICNGSAGNVFFTGYDSPQASTHDLLALADHPSWVRLTRSATDWGSQWYYDGANMPNSCSTARDFLQSIGLYSGAVFNCDEFPYKSTAEGGPGASLQLIFAFDNQAQGRLLNQFYGAANGCAIPRDAGPASQFLVLPVLTMPTLWTCAN